VAEDLDVIRYSGAQCGGDVSRSDRIALQYIGTAEKGPVSKFAVQAAYHAYTTHGVVAQSKRRDCDGRVEDRVLGDVAEVHEGGSFGGPVVFGPHLGAGGVDVAQVILDGEVVAELKVRCSGVVFGVH
jgi:hypothetical protein